MTSKGAAMVIEYLSMRIFEIQDLKSKLDKEEQQHRNRIAELEKIRDKPEAIQALRIIEVK